MGYADVFFDLKKLDLKTAREVLRWAQPRSLRIDVDVLDCAKSWARQKADISFDDALNFLDDSSVGFFVIILRRGLSAMGLLSDDSNSHAVLEIGIRNIHKGSPLNSPEYFIFMYLPPERLDDLKKEFDIQPRS